MMELQHLHKLVVAAGFATTSFIFNKEALQLPAAILYPIISTDTASPCATPVFKELSEAVILTLSRLNRASLGSH